MTVTELRYIPRPEQEDRSCSPDIMVGAYLMSHFKSACENCGCTETPQWRKGWFSDILGRSVLLCNRCGLKFHKVKFSKEFHKFLTLE